MTHALKLGCAREHRSSERQPASVVVDREMKSDTLMLDYDEASFLAYILEGFIYNHAGDLTTHIGSKRRQEFAKQVQAKLETFTDISQRCGVLCNHADSKGDWPSCNLRPHLDARHRALDLGTQREVHWIGNGAKNYSEQEDQR